MPKLSLIDKFGIQTEYKNVSGIKLLSETNENILFSDGVPALLTLENNLATENTLVHLQGSYLGESIDPLELNDYLDLYHLLSTNKLPLYVDIVSPKLNLINQPINITTTDIVDISNYRLLQVNDPNLIPENIKLNKTILGVSGVFNSYLAESDKQLLDYSTLLAATTSTSHWFNRDNRSDLTFIASFDFSHILDMSGMFKNCFSLTTVPQLDTSNVTNMSEMFYYCYNLTSLPVFDCSKATNLDFLFYNCSRLSNFPVLNAINASSFVGTFQYCSKLTTVNLTITNKALNTSMMFHSCLKLTTVPQLDTSNVTNMSGMFYKCLSLTTIPQLDTSNVIDMSSLFWGCTNLTTVPQLDTSNVTNMHWMFYDCSSLTTVPQLDTSNVTDMSGMFEDCISLTTIPQLDTSNVIDMSSMFYNCSSLAGELTLNLPSVKTLKNTFVNTALSSIKINGLHDFNSSITRDGFLGNTFYNCHKLETIDLSYFSSYSLNVDYSYYNATTFNNCYKLKTLILRDGDSFYSFYYKKPSYVSSIPTYNTIFKNCYHMLGTYHATYNPDSKRDGRVYIPLTRWKNHVGEEGSMDVLFPLEYYTTDASCDSDLDPEKHDKYILTFSDTNGYNSGEILYSLDNGETWVDLLSVPIIYSKSNGLKRRAIFDIKTIKFKLKSNYTSSALYFVYGDESTGTYACGSTEEISTFTLTKNTSIQVSHRTVSTA